MGGFLEEIRPAVLRSLQAWKERYPQVGGAASPPPPFLPPAGEGCGVIAEVKAASPSAGVLFAGADPAGLADSYAAGGAEAVSVVVEEERFGGSPELFARVASRTRLPLLWKDFVLDPFQVRMAARMGASAILLIAAFLEGKELESLIVLCRREGLRPLVEVHSEKELEKALSAGADLVGVNSRDLDTLKVELEVHRRLAPGLAGVDAVAESGVTSSEQVRELREMGYRAVLVGGALAGAPDPRVRTAALAGAGRRR